MTGAQLLDALLKLPKEQLQREFCFYDSLTNQLIPITEISFSDQQSVYLNNVETSADVAVVE
jgi:hypothetical protein